MSIHKSLVVKSQLLRARNVWSRLERITKLEEDGHFAEGQSIFGLPKVRTRIKVRSAKPAQVSEGGEATAAEPEEGSEQTDAKAKP